MAIQFPRVDSGFYALNDFTESVYLNGEEHSSVRLYPRISGGWCIFVTVWIRGTSTSAQNVSVEFDTYTEAKAGFRRAVRWLHALRDDYEAFMARTRRECKHEVVYPHEVGELDPHRQPGKYRIVYMCRDCLGQQECIIEPNKEGIWA